MALIFGHISSWVLKTGNRLVDKAAILKMVLHLRQLLMATKHRGAFEQVYCGFSQSCNALSRCPDDELNRLPSEWLRDLIRDLDDDESAAKLCATRRSAGLPFMFQAIFSLEVEMGRDELFAYSMESLLTMASSKGSIHSLNILRSLYRESRLNQVIGPYVARGLMIAISGFEANDWAVRLK